MSVYLKWSTNIPITPTVVIINLPSVMPVITKKTYILVVLG